MKKFNLFVIAILAATSLALTACDMDNDEHAETIAPVTDAANPAADADAVAEPETVDADAAAEAAAAAQ